MKRFLALLLAALCLLACLSGCVAGGADQAAETDSQLAPEQAATQAAESTQDKMSLSDIIRVPFGYLLEWLYQFANNYGVALILFSLIIKLILLPMSIKSKKSTLKMSRLAPIVKAMESKYGDDKQKYQMAVQQLYKEEGVSMGGGCLWSFIPLLILLPLYYVIREPLTYMLHNSRSVSAAIVAFVRASGENLGANTYYAQLAAYVEPLRALAVTANANLTAIDFSFLGLDLAAIPTFKIWEVAKEGWSQIGLFLLPIASAGFQMLSMLISQKMSGQVATNADGERDEEAAKQQAKTNMTMMLMMPLMSLWIGYSMPAALSIYWIAQALFGTVQDYFLTIHFRKIYDAEDAERQERAALKRAEEIEKERQRQLRREQNPDGIMDNESKTKLRQQAKDAADRAAREYEAKKNPAPAVQDEKKPLSGDAARPYAKGRAYDPTHYGKKADAQSADASTEE